MGRRTNITGGEEMSYRTVKYLQILIRELVKLSDEAE